MKTFIDTKKRTWEVALSIGAARRVRELASVDIYTLTDDEMKGYRELIANVDKLATVIYVLCKPQADSAGVTGEGFLEGLSGEVILAMAKAFEEEFIDFFPDPLRAKALRVILDAAERMTAEHWAVAMAVLDAASAQSSIYGNSPATSASTPTRSRSGGFSGWLKGKLGGIGTRRPSSASPSTTDPR